MTFTASGVCSSSGANGSLITLSGVAGMCTVTANQASNANYTAAPAVMQSFNVIDAGAELFPPACTVPPGWFTPPGANAGWGVGTDFASQGNCSFKSNPVPNLGIFGPNARIALTANFDAGNISFMRRVSSEPEYKCFRLLIDNVQQSVSGSCTQLGGYLTPSVTAVGASGESPFTLVTVPVSPGTHTVVLSYDKDSDCCVQGLDAAWVDQLSMPLSTSITSTNFAFGSYGTFMNISVTATNFPLTYSATGLPPGLTINTATGVISGFPSAVGNYSAMITAANPAGVNPAASATQSFSFFIGKASQSIIFNPLANRLTTSPGFTATATGGNSGNPVTFVASGVCTSGGTNGANIVLTGAAGTCSITVSQAGNANYEDAGSYARTFEVSLASQELFPPACAMPAGWVTPGGATTGWMVSTAEQASAGACSLKSMPMTVTAPQYQADIQFTGTFATGDIRFKYYVSSEPEWKCIQFFIDGIAQNLGGSCSARGLTGASGETGWVTMSVPITAGVHTIKWRYDKDSLCCTQGADAAWIDEVVLPLFTLSVTRNGTGSGTVASDPAGISCAPTCSAPLSGNVRLTASPAFLSFFAGWSGGGCSGTGACIVSMDAAKSVTATFTTASPPGPPQNVTASPTNGGASISFSPPASDGGSPITSYGANCAAAGQTTVFQSGSGSPLVMSGMANGVQYTCTVGAGSFAGSGPTVMVNVTPRTVPGAPTSAAATAGNAQASIAFVAPASNGGSMITGYTATCTSMTAVTRTGTAAMSPVVVTGMTNGTAYDCSVVATNAAGNGVASNTTAVTPRTVPGTPSFQVRNFDGRAMVDFAPPLSDGGSAITGYTLTCNPGGLTASGMDSPFLLTGLSNGMTYPCTLTAMNAVGSSAPAMFNFQPQVNTGTVIYANVCTACHVAPPIVPQLNAAGTTAAVLNYVITNQATMAANPSVTALTAAERTAIANYLQASLPVAPFTTPFNTPRSIDLSAQVALGTIAFETLEVVSGPAHGMLSAFTGTSITYTPAAGYAGADTFTYRGKRTNPTALTGDARTVNITVQPPPVPVITSANTASGTNGQPFSYQITATNGPTGFDASGFPGGVGVNMMTGLVSGTPNAGGTFNAMVSASNAGGPGTQMVTVTIAPAAQSITFAAQMPASRNFSAMGFAISPLAAASSGLAVVYSSNTPGVCSVAGTTVTMLAAGTCTIAANQPGNASFLPAVEATSSLTITAVAPGAPTIGMATAGSNQASIAFTAPTNTGGAGITGYAASCTPSGSGTGAVSPITVMGLSNGTTYTCSVRAANSAGQGPASGTVMVTPQPTPTPPSITSANAATFTVGVPGSFSATATGTPSTFTWTLTAGMLPAGVSLTPSGLISGTPSVAGAFPVTLMVANGQMPNASYGFTLTVNKATQTINFANPGSRTLGTGGVALSAVASSSLAVSFVSDTPATCSVAGSTATLIAVGTCTLRAQQAGNANFNAAPDVTQSFSVLQGSQSISFPAQVSPRAFVQGGTFMLAGPISATSGLAVSLGSQTSAVCTVAGTTVTMLRAGTCTLAANQAGNANYTAAAQVTQSIVLTGTAPGAPTLNSATPGDGKVTLAFTAPASDGGSAITSYNATCGAVTVAGPVSPIAVTGLSNGMAYSCSVRAVNVTGQGAASGTMMATPAALAGATVWTGSCALGGCHGAGSNPVGFRLNVGGNTTTLLDYVIPRQPSMAGLLGGMSAANRLAVAQYIADFIPAVSVTTPFNTPVDVDVSPQVILNTFVAALTTLEVVTPPASGTLSAFTGTTATYTPAAGFSGTVSFTYRAKNVAAPSGPAPQGPYDTDIRTVTITVQGAAPVITSATSAGATVGQAFSYQIAASNLPTGYGATGLPGWLSVNTMTGVLSGTPPGAGSSMVTISAMNANGSGNATLTINVAATPQLITFGAQASPVNYVQGGTVMISPTAMGGGSGNPIVYSSATPAVCSVSGATYTMVSAGICTIAANQAGNATYAAAAQVMQSVTINGSAPAAPTIGAAFGGNTQATVNFTPPTNTGGLPITGYIVNCSGFGATGASSPITVSGLINGTMYSCSVQASNAAGTSMASGSVSVTPVAALLSKVESRKVHGAAGTFNILIDHTLPVGGALTVEPRVIGMGHTIVFTLTGPATIAGTASVAPAGMASAMVSGNEVIVTLTGVPDNTRATVTVNGINGGLNVSASLGFLVGDVSGNRAVAAADVTAIRAVAGQTTDAANFRHDLNTTGLIGAADIAAARNRVNLTLPP